MNNNDVHEDDNDANDNDNDDDDNDDYDVARANTAGQKHVGAAKANTTGLGPSMARFNAQTTLQRKLIIATNPLHAPTQHWSAPCKSSVLCPHFFVRPCPPKD